MLFVIGRMNGSLQSLQIPFKIWGHVLGRNL